MFYLHLGRLRGFVTQQQVFDIVFHVMWLFLLYNFAEIEFILIFIQSIRSNFIETQSDTCTIYLELPQ